MCGHTLTTCSTKKKFFLFFYIVPIGSTRFDGQDDLLYENTIKAEKGKHRDYDNEMTRVNK